MLPYKRDKIDPFGKLFFPSKQLDSSRVVSLPHRDSIAILTIAQSEYTDRRP